MDVETEKLYRDAMTCAGMYPREERKRFLGENMLSLLRGRHPQDVIQIMWHRACVMSNEARKDVFDRQQNTKHVCGGHMNRSRLNSWSGGGGMKVGRTPELYRTLSCEKDQVRFVVYHNPGVCGPCWCGSTRPGRECHREHACVQTRENFTHSWRTICDAAQPQNAACSNGLGAPMRDANHRDRIIAYEAIFICRASGNVHWCGNACDFQPAASDGVMVCPWSLLPLHTEIDDGAIPLPVGALRTTQVTPPKPT